MGCAVYKIFKSNLEYIFDEFLDSAFEPVHVLERDFEHSTLLKKLQPLTYSAYLNEWIRDEIDSGRLEIRGDDFYRAEQFYKPEE